MPQFFDFGYDINLTIEAKGELSSRGGETTASLGRQIEPPRTLLLIKRPNPAKLDKTMSVKIDIRLARYKQKHA